MTRIHTFVGGGFSENVYLAVCEESGLGVVIDPGAAASSMVRFLQEEGISLDAILITHGHVDHVEGIPVVRDAFPDAPVYLNDKDKPLYTRSEAQTSAFNLPPIGPLPDPHKNMSHGDTLTFGKMELQVRHVPGHSPGHVIFYLEEEEVAFVGDLVFQGAIGRSDLPGGDFHQLMESIRTQVLSLPNEIRLLSGHGPETTVGWERKSNPFLVGNFGGELV